MTRRRPRPARSDWGAAVLFVGLAVLLIVVGEMQTVAAGGSPGGEFAGAALRGLMILAAGIALAATLPEPEREVRAARRLGFWIAALVPFVWLVFQWLVVIVGATAGWGALAWVVTTPLPPFWLGVVTGTVLRQVWGR